MPTKVLHPIPPFDPSFNATLDESMLAHAKRLWAHATEKKRSIELLYSGGIDSTAVLVAMLQTAPSKEHLTRVLRLKLAQRAITEYPLFFERYISNRIEYTLLDDNVDICEHLDSEALIVTGELGDQLFGSNTMQRAIKTGIPLDGPWQQARFWQDPLFKYQGPE